MGGTLAFRKTDCAITIGSGVRPLHKTKIWGSYRTSSLPLVLGETRITDYEWNDVADWIDTVLNDSEQHEEIFNIFQKNNGGLIYGRAGTGKSFVAKNIIIKLNDNYKVIAFTNKAAHNYERAQQFIDT